MSESSQTVEKIDGGDLPYHIRIAGSRARAEEIQKQISGLQLELVKLEGAAQSWGEHLSEKYRLADGGFVDESGTITRSR